LVIPVISMIEALISGHLARSKYFDLGVEPLSH
jgi:hypothetical protein